MKITQENEMRRKKLVESYNRAKSKATKKARYDALMEFEEEMLRLDQNG